MTRPGGSRLVWDRLGALLLLAFAVYIVAVARQLTYVQGRVPGPGFAPFWIGVGLGVAALALLAGTRREGRGGVAAVQPEEEPRPPVRPRTLVAIGAVSVAAVALVERVGMVMALGLMLAAMIRVLGGSWRTAVLAAVALPLLFYLLFGLWLKVPLPRGPWGF